MKVEASRCEQGQVPESTAGFFRLEGGLTGFWEVLVSVFRIGFMGGSPVKVEASQVSQRCQEFMEAPLAAEALMLLTVRRMISSFIGLHVVVSMCVCARVFSNMCIDIHVGPSACAHDMHACNVCVCVYTYMCFQYMLMCVYVNVCTKKCLYTC